jgi:phosphate transport system permease protein
MREQEKKQPEAASPFELNAKAKHSKKAKDRSIKFFFRNCAVLTIAILTLITVFLFKEGLGFFTQEYDALVSYRQSGMEYVDIQQQPIDTYVRLHQNLIRIRADWINHLREVEQLSVNQVQARIETSKVNDLFFGYLEASYPVRDYLASQLDFAKSVEQKYFTKNLKTEAQWSKDSTDYQKAIQQIQDQRTEYSRLIDMLALEAKQRVRSGILIDWPNEKISQQYTEFVEAQSRFTDSLNSTNLQLDTYNFSQPVAFKNVFMSFLTGRVWSSSSASKDQYGLLPLLTGSLSISIIALLIAVPFSVSAAIYLNQIAGPTERNIIKPYIEFISAIPSVVIGFFGVAVFGQGVLNLSNLPLLSWLPFFPIQERLNALTAGALLALMATPTIFTLAEDAINNVPGKLREASLAMGATRLQTIFKVIVPSALSGIISAIMLGFGRIIGETMVVLLCAGNRIKIPDFMEGIGAVFEPVHTMTGVIAQEMGEVVQGSLHYRALFMVGIVLFFLSLIVNYSAQWVLRKYGSERN